MQGGVVKLVKEVLEGCRCQEKIMQLMEQRRRNGKLPLWIGSIVECDCGKIFQLTDHFDGPYWQARTSR